MPPSDRGGVRLQTMMKTRRVAVRRKAEIDRAKAEIDEKKAAGRKAAGSKEKRQSRIEQTIGQKKIFGEKRIGGY